MAVSISSVSGTLTHGSTLTINGSGLGAHTDFGGAESFLCRAWNDFSVDRYDGGWETDGLLTLDANLSLQTSGALGGACSTYLSKKNINQSSAQNQGCITTFGVGDVRYWHCSFWYYETAGLNVGNAGTKLFRLYYDNEAGASAGNIYFGPNFENATTINDGLNRYTGTSAFGGTAAFTSLIADTWSFWEVTACKPGAGVSSVFGSDDYLELYVTIPGQGRQRLMRRGSGLASNPVPNEGTDANENHQWLNNLSSAAGHTQGDLGNHLNDAEEAGHEMRYHDAFMNHTISRVVIDEASTFAAMNKPHYQIPTSWAADGSQIQVTLNRDRHASLTGKYLYVVNALNEVNANGFLLSGAASGSIGRYRRLTRRAA